MILKIILIIVIIVVVILAYYTIREYRPADVESVAVQGEAGNGAVSGDESYSIITYNIGYGALGETEDFFMDGGSKVRPDSEEIVLINMDQILEHMIAENPDFLFIQEADRNSTRSYYVDEPALIQERLGGNTAFAPIYKCDFVPYPLPPVGKVESGLQVISDYEISEANRYALPVAFSWPIRTCNLKRAILMTRYPIAGSDKELVLMNFHLEAYDSGEGKAAQLGQLMNLISEEYEAGNYVIAGGDFNHSFSDLESWPEVSDDWIPGQISQNDLPEGFTLTVADNEPTSRLLNHAYTGDYNTTQVYSIDGFIVSDNLNVQSIKVLHTGFANSDHQPVKMEFSFE